MIFGLHRDVNENDGYFCVASTLTKKQLGGGSRAPTAATGARGSADPPPAQNERSTPPRATGNTSQSPQRSTGGPGC